MQKKFIPKRVALGIVGAGNVIGMPAVLLDSRIPHLPLAIATFAVFTLAIAAILGAFMLVSAVTAPDRYFR